jgi:hypothetical protein
MPSIRAFFASRAFWVSVRTVGSCVAVFAMATAMVAAAAPAFVFPPVLERFPDGAIEWSARVSCAEPSALLGARVDFDFDFDLDGRGDTAASSALSPADCEEGMLSVRRGFFPPRAAVLRARLRSPAREDRPDSVLDAHSLLTAGIGAPLSLHRFCARPQSGEPEWIELRNISIVPVSLAKVKLEGRALSGWLDPGATLTVGAAGDTAELRAWQPGARLLAPSSWSSLRNTGDTLRLTFEDGSDAGTLHGSGARVLDSVVYGAAAAPREGCASVPAEETGAAAHGFSLDAPRRWSRRAGPVTVTVSAPAAGSPGSYDLRVFDLDGVEVCALGRGAAGPNAYSLSPASCARLRASSTAVILHLQPRGAPGVRAVVRILP